MSTMFRPAERKKLKLRMAICSPAGYGKTYTGLRLIYPLAAGGRIAVIDTEHGAASKYKGLSPDGTPWLFDVCELQHFAPTAYTAAIREAVQAGYSALLIDSLSHAWAGVGGALEQVDRKAAASGGNSYVAWKDVTPQHNELVETILAAPIHVIATMRTRVEYELMEELNKAGRKVMVPHKVGMKPVQREGMDYEFDVVGDMDEFHTLIIGKTRCPAIDGQRVVKPGPAFMTPVLAWLDEGISAPAAPQFVPSVTAATSSALVTEASQQKPSAGNGSAATEARPGHCSPFQRQEIIRLAQALGWSAAQVKAKVQTFSREAIADLRQEQAESIITELTQLDSKNQAQGVF